MRPMSRRCATSSEGKFPTLHLVGRNGMHRYNNQDHAMMTAMLTVENILAGADPRRLDGERGGRTTTRRADAVVVLGLRGTGGRAARARAAPVLPRPRTASPAGDRLYTG